MIDAFMAQPAVVQALLALMALVVFYYLHHAVQITIVVALTVIWIVLHLFG